MTLSSTTDLTARQGEWTAERRSQRIALDVCIRVQRGDGTVADCRCIDASEEGFGIASDSALEIGEIVRLTIGRVDRGPSFIARVVWQHGDRMGLRCVASND
jgi:hypothetical protein